MVVVVGGSDGSGGGGGGVVNVNAISGQNKIFKYSKLLLLVKLKKRNYYYYSCYILLFISMYSSSYDYCCYSFYFCVFSIL